MALSIKSPVLPRVLPFATFMAFIAVEEGLRFLMKKHLLAIDGGDLLYLYPVKVIATLAVFLLFMRSYDELRLRDLASVPHTIVSIATGVVVFILWIRMDWTFGTSGVPAGYDPSRLPEGVRSLFLAFRIFGAAMVVPVVEELFWRSFIMRYIVDTDFERVPVGMFAWPAFLVTALLFGLEHHYVVAGIMAGIAYNLLACWTRSIMHCILSHAVTNFILAMYVLATGEWRFW